MQDEGDQVLFPILTFLWPGVQ